MSEFKTLLNKIEIFLEKENTQILNLLQNGLSEDQITNHFDLMPLPPYCLTELYSWRNGIMDSWFGSKQIQEIELFPGGIFLSLEHAIKVYDIFTKQQHLWEMKYFPIFSDGGGDYLLVDMDPTSKGYEGIFLFSPSILLSGEVESIYDSLFAMLRTIYTCYERRAFYYESQNRFIEVNYDLRQQIASTENPNSAYWRR